VDIAEGMTGPEVAGTTQVLHTLVLAKRALVSSRLK